MDGYLHTIIGPMFSGKTSFMLHELERFARAGKHVVLFSADNRAEEPVVHSQRPIYKGVVVDKTRDINDILRKGLRFEVIGVDEVQFLDESLHQVLSSLVEQGRIVYASGLDQDIRKEPFMTTLMLIPHSEKLTRLTSVCHKCGSLLAIRNVRKVKSEERVLEGAADVYEVRCRNCREDMERLERSRLL